MPQKKKSRRHTKPLNPRKRAVFVVSYGVVLFLVSVLLVFVLELIGSFFVTLPTEALVRSARLNHTWEPNGETVHTEWIADNPDYPDPYVHYYNRQGWVEDYDLTQEKPTGTYRIFYVGDSFTEGCVPMEESVPSRVEAHLNTHFGSDDTRFEVINTGTWSYSPVIHYILIRYFIQPFQPDVIVLNVDMTDDFDDWKYRQTLITDEEGNPYAAPPRHLYSSQYIDTLEGAVKADFFSRLNLYLAENSFLYNWINHARSEPQQPNFSMTEDTAESAELLYPRWAWCQHQWDEATRENTKYTLDVIERIADYCNTSGIKLLLTGVPHYQQFAQDNDGLTRWSTQPHKEIERIAQKKSVAYLDSHGALRSQIQGSRQDEFYYRGNMHFNPRGNQLWAEAHMRAISDPKNRLLPPSAYASGFKETS